MIFIGADHRGYRLKAKINEELVEASAEVTDVGAEQYVADDDFTDVAIELGEKLVKKKGRGILICGSGVGVCVAVNKVGGIRGGIGFEPRQVRKGVEDDDMNVLCLSADWVDDETNLGLVKVFLESQFVTEKRRMRRIKKIKEYETDQR